MPYRPSKQLQSAIETSITRIAKTGGSEEWWKKFWALAGMMIGEAQAEVVRGLEPDLAIEGELVEVEGREVLGKVRDHEKACIDQITLEQRRPEVDSPLIATLCNSVRLARQHLDFLEKDSKRVPEEVVVARLENIHDRMINHRSADTEVRDLIRLLSKKE